MNQVNSSGQTALDIVNKFTTSRAGRELKQLLKGMSFGCFILLICLSINIFYWQLIISSLLAQWGVCTTKREVKYYCTMISTRCTEKFPPGEVPITCKISDQDKFRQSAKLWGRTSSHHKKMMGTCQGFYQQTLRKPKTFDFEYQHIQKSKNTWWRSTHGSQL